MQVNFSVYLKKVFFLSFEAWHLQKMDAMALCFRCNIIRPEGTLYLADMGFPKEEHTYTGLPDTSADGKRKLFFNDGFLEGKAGSVHTSGFLKLGKKSVLIHTDAHGGKLQCDIQNRIIDHDIRIQRPVIIVRRTAVMAFSGFHDITDLHDADI